MSLYRKNETDLQMYSGDTGSLRINGLPTDKNYKVYLEVTRGSNLEKIFEIMVESNGSSSIVFDISAEKSNLLTVKNINAPEVFYWAVKLCDENGTEDTILPKTEVDHETGLATFAKPYKLFVNYKMVEGEVNE